MNFLLLLLCVPAFLIASSADAQSYYTFTDSDGVTHFVDSLLLVPPQYRKQVESQVEPESQTDSKAADSGQKNPATPTSLSQGTSPNMANTPVDVASPTSEMTPTSSRTGNGESTSTSEAAKAKDAEDKAALVPTLEMLSDSSQDNGQDKAYWQNLLEATRALKAASSAEVAAIDAELIRLRTLSTAPALKRIQELSAQKEVLLANEQVADRLLEEEIPRRARKAGAPPGWLR